MIDRFDPTVTIRQFESLMSTVHARGEFPGVGMLYNQELELLDFGLVGYALASSPNLAYAIRILTRYHPILTNRTSLTLRKQRGYALLLQSVRSGFAHQEALVIEELMAGAWRLMRLLLPPTTDLSDAQIDFRFAPPKHERIVRRLLGCEVRYGQPHSAIRFPLDWLRGEINTANSSIAIMTEAQCSRVLSELNETYHEPEKELVFDICRTLLAKPRHHLLREGDVARALGVSPRTLRHGLHRCGSTFRELSKQVRLELARQYLVQTKLSVEEIADLIGYSQPSAFYRAFKQMYDTTPRMLRKSLSPSREEQRGIEVDQARQR
jgi:AraC-like DNA-binding protein